MTLESVVPLVVSTLGGAAVGVERQWSGHAEGERRALAGCARSPCWAGWRAGRPTLDNDGQWRAALLLGGAAALVVAAYAAASRRDVDGTTEVAALVVLAAGVLAGIGEFDWRAASSRSPCCCWSRSRGCTGWSDAGRPRVSCRGALCRDRSWFFRCCPKARSAVGGIALGPLWALVLFFSGLALRLHGAPIVGDREGCRRGSPRRARLVDQRHADVRPSEPGARH